MSQRSLLERVLLPVNAASVVTAIIFESVPPHSRLGGILFWPQNTWSFLHLAPGSPLGSRISFLVVLALLSVVLVAVMLLSGTGSLGIHLPTVQGVLAVSGPMLGWMLVMREDWPVKAMTGIETGALLLYVSYHARKTTTPKWWENAFILAVCFGFWIYLYHQYVDPVFLTVPVCGCLSYLAWATAPRLRTPVLNQLV
jgi:hypothetical protein